ncbi:MAG TPA: tetratricopeptide repeat protein, partial [Gemmatimonadales bacterium]|nr:tetratricopeptide repeat protein [Gemmatimonadales bacterium]
RGQAYPRPVKETPRPVAEPKPLPVDEPLPHEFPETTAPEGLLVNEPQLDASSPAGDDLIIDPLLTNTTGGGADSLLGIERIGDTVEPLADLTSPLDIQRGADSSSLDIQPMTLDGMEGTALGGGFSSNEASPLDFTVEPERNPLDFPDDLIVSLPDTETGFNLGTDTSMAIESDPLGLSPPNAGVPLITPEPRGNESLADLENRVLDDPENPDVHLALAEKLLSLGETDRVTEELELALAGFEDRQDWARASEMANRLVKLTPDSIGHHQKRVELAYRMGDRGPLLEAYLGLGDALAKSGALDKAAAVYGRVIEHDPGNARAAAALEKVGGGPAPVAAKGAAAPKAAPAPNAAPAPKAETRAAPKGSAPADAQSDSKPKPEPAASDDDFVDLGSMLRDEHSRRDTRMRVNRREPQGQDEQREFREILEQFKRGIDENLESDDYQSHYDLGVAFKEMGLLDEAIAEFQKALRASDGRLRTSEALGMAFFEKGQYAVCESVLRRAVDGLDGTDESKIGLLYWLGRASEALGKKGDAVASYERAVAVDIRFMDLSERIHRLTAGRRQ